MGIRHSYVTNVTGYDVSNKTHCFVIVLLGKKNTCGPCAANVDIFVFYLVKGGFIIGRVTSYCAVVSSDCTRHEVIVRSSVPYTPLTNWRVTQH